MSADTFIDELAEMFAEDDAPAGMEALSLSAHMLQTAAAASAAGGSDSLIGAALLHDIGHWLVSDDTDGAVEQTDRQHETVGANVLLAHFGKDVCEPVRLHVAAKRYLCAREPTYFANLSPASVYSLQLQGGPLSPDEVLAFERLDGSHAAVALRRWDEYGKIPDLVVPGFDHYRPLLKSLARRT